jgi:parallel beta-helix repeat protein
MRAVWIVGVIVVAMLAGAAPASADSDFLSVNTTADGADLAADNTCDADAAAGLQCTLRAAMQEAQDGDADFDIIMFDPAIHGQTVELTSSLPASAQITEPLILDPCFPAAPGQPCAGVRYASGVAGGPHDIFRVNGGAVAINNLALSNAATAIDAVSAVTFVANNNWFGVRVDGTTADANVVGMRVAVDDAGIDSNLFANSSESGLRVVAADRVSIQNSRFGVLPDLQTPAPNTVENIEVVGTGGDRPQNTLIGGRVPAHGVGTPECDGGCNVIAAATDPTGFGIDLLGETAQGEISATGTTIRGNYFGLDYFGSSPAGANPLRNGTNIRVGDAANTTIGGPGEAGNPNGDRNYIANGHFGITADNLTIRNNLIGLDRTGTASRPFTAGSGQPMILGSIPTAPLQLIDNHVSAAAGNANTDIAGQNAVVQGNRFGVGTDGGDVPGGFSAIRLVELTEGPNEGGHQIGGSGAGQGNVFDNTTARGLSIEGSDNNVIRGNTFRGGAGPAIWIDEFSGTKATGNAVGGDSAGQANTFADYQSGDAIRISADGSDGNTIAANTGTVGEQFIDLGNDGTGNNAATGPNDGIQPPQFTVAGPNWAKGTGARANATVRVFRKATSADGEVGALLGSAQADGSGNWTVNYAGADLTGINNVTATQTDSNGNTSELRIPEQPIDRTAPETSIIPPFPSDPDTRPTADRTPSFSYAGSSATDSFQCSLVPEGAAPSFQACPGTGNGTFTPAGDLADGTYVFGVRAEDEAGNLDASPATRRVTVDTTPPNTSIDAPYPADPDSKPSNDRTPTFNYSGSGGPESFECSLVPQGSAPSFHGCPANGSYTHGSELADGTYVFHVRAEDAAGNKDPSPATRPVTIDATPPETAITEGPSGATADRRPSFAFASEPGATFRCSLVGQGQADAFESCPAVSGSGAFQPANDLPAGPYVFKVHATDAAGNDDPTPAERAFTVEGGAADTDPPETTVKKTKVRGDDAKITFTSDEPGSTFTCRLDKEKAKPCTSPRKIRNLDDGKHKLTITATDPAGNTDPSAAKAKFRIDDS